MRGRKEREEGEVRKRETEVRGGRERRDERGEKA